MFLIMMVCTALAAVLFLQQYQKGVREIKQGIYRSDREGEAHEETFVAHMEDGTRVEVPVEIFSRELSEEEKQKLLDQAQKEFVQTYLGENTSENAVTEDLKFAFSYVDGQVMAVYESSQPQYLWDDGTVHTDALAQTGETEPVKITVNFTCQDLQMEYVCYVILQQKVPAGETDETTGIQNAVKEQETASRTRQTFQLPDTVNGQKVTWRKKVDYRPLFLPVVGIVLIICIQQKPLQDKKKEQNRSERKRAELDGTISSDRRLAYSMKNGESVEEQALEDARITGRSSMETAVAEYDAFLAGQLETGDVLPKAEHEQLEEKVADLKTAVLAAQQAYNNRKEMEDRLSEGLDQEVEYQKRRGRIWMTDLQGTQTKLQEQTGNYERIFKREFVLKLYEAAKAAKQDIAEINKELRKLQFSTKYQFEVKLLDDKSDYAKLLRYAEYLQETNNLADGQFSLTGLMGYDDDEVEKREKEIRDLINRMIDSDDKTEIESFADYRNYMSYEIIINNDEVKDGKLSRQVGYNSGAGTQIPYTIILSAALSMLYNARPKSVRLLFIDEPFEKMSDHNIKLMLDFFRDQNFQVIFCAPPNKLESIGSECGVIIPVLKNGNDDMQIGKVKFHDED